MPNADTERLLGELGESIIKRAKRGESVDDSLIDEYLEMARTLDADSTLYYTEWLAKRIAEYYDNDSDYEPIHFLTLEEKVLESYAQGGISHIDLIRASGYSIDAEGRLRDNFGDIVSSEHSSLYVQSQFTCDSCGWSMDVLLSETRTAHEPGCSVFGGMNV